MRKDTVDYIKHYNSLIFKHGNKEKPEGYSELHHIKPRSHGGSDDVSNLVYLSARCHYLAHWLLLKIFNDIPMTHAFHLMSSCNRYNAKGYAVAKAKKSELMKIINPMFDRSKAKLQGSKLVKEVKKERAKGLDQSMNRSKFLAGNQRNAKLRYLVTHPNGDMSIVTSMRGFCKEHDLNQTCMTRVCKGKLDSHYGYKAIYLAADA